MVTGQVRLNGLTDRAMIFVYQAKEHEPTLVLDRVRRAPRAGDAPGGLNDAVLSWRGSEGLEAVSTLLRKLGAAPLNGLPALDSLPGPGGSGGWDWAADR